MTYWVNEWMNEWINDEPVHRTALATPGLLIIQNTYFCLLIHLQVWNCGQSKFPWNLNCPPFGFSGKYYESDNMLSGSSTCKTPY